MKDEVEDVARSLADDVDLFSEADGEGQTLVERNLYGTSREES